MITRSHVKISRGFLHLPLILGNEWDVIHQKLDKALIFRSYYRSISIDDVNEKLIAVILLLKNITTVNKIKKQMKIDNNLLLSFLNFLFKNGIINNSFPTKHSFVQKREIQHFFDSSLMQKGELKKIGIFYSRLITRELIDYFVAHCKVDITIYMFDSNNKVQGRNGNKLNLISKQINIVSLNKKQKEKLEGEFKKQDLLLGATDNNKFNLLINNVAIQNRIRWIPLLLDFKESRGYIGPTVQSSSDSCLECLQRRRAEGKLYSKKDVLIQRRDKISQTFKKSIIHQFILYVVDITCQVLCNNVNLSNYVSIFDFYTGKLNKSYLLKKYNCTCFSTRDEPKTTLTLESRIVSFKENGLRTCSPQEVFKKSEKLIGEIGIIASVKKIDRKDKELNIVTYRSISANPLKKNYAEYSRVHFGKGLTDIQNMNSAFLEGVERYYGKMIDYKKCVYDSYENLKDNAVDPLKFVMPSNIRYSSKKEYTGFKAIRSQQKNQYYSP